MSEDDSVEHEGKWTRADLPRWDKIRDADDMAGNGLRSRVIDIALNEVVEHLNTHYPKPQPHDCGETIDALNHNRDALVENRDQSISSLQHLLATAEADRDRWRRARDTTRQERDEWEDKYLNADEELHRTRLERDAAVARADQLRDERDDAVQSCMAVGRERDEARREWAGWREQSARRVEQLRVVERERDAAVARAEGIDRDYRECQESLIEVSLERDEWKARAEALEAEAEEAFEQGATWHKEQSAPAVSRDEIEKVVEAVFDREAGYDYGSDKPWPGTEPVASAVWDYLKGADPAVYVVRESDLDTIEVEQDSHDEWFADGEHIYSNGAEDARNLAAGHLRMAVRRLAVARAIEAEQAVDPVEEQTDALADILYGDELVTDQMRGVLERVVRAGMLFPEQEADQ